MCKVTRTEDQNLELFDGAFWADAWARARQKSSLYREGYDESSWNAFWNQYAGTYLKVNQALEEHLRTLVSSWREEGLVGPSSRVLDIGCGPGAYALPLAREVREVVALDTAPQMLETLAQAARQQELSNVVPFQGHWEKVNFDREFDLVLAAISPAIYNYETLMKMNEASRGSCILISYRHYHAPLREILWQKLMKEKLISRAFEITYPFNILYQEGFNPNLRFMEQDYCYTEKTAVIRDNFRAYFRIFGKDENSVDRTLDEIFNGSAQDGEITEKVSSCLAVMWWQAR
ncbi:MAG: methyltransferase domain-containing protein [Bacillota bacterium]